MSDKKQIPLVILYPIGGGYVNNTTPTVSGTGLPGAVGYININNISYSTTIRPDGTWSVQITDQLVDGQSYTISAVQVDGEQNVNTALDVSFTVNAAQDLACTVTNPVANGYVNTTKPTISGNGIAGAIVEVSSNGNSYSSIVNPDGSWQVPIIKPLNEGQNTIAVTQNDMGNVSQAIGVSFTVDTVAPNNPIITEPKDVGYVYTPSPTVSGMGEAGAVVNLSLNNKEYQAPVTQDGSWNVSIGDKLKDESYILTARQADVAGNISPDTTVLFEVNTKRPNPPTITAPNITNNSKPKVKGISDEGSTIDVMVNQSHYTTVVNRGGKWDVELSEELSDGAYTISATQTDKAGRVSEPNMVSFIVDTIAPLAPVILYPEDRGYVLSGAVVVCGTGEPNARVEINLQDKKYNTSVSMDGKWQIYIAELTEGINNTLAATQIDAAGNISATTFISFLVDPNALPIPEVTSPSGGGYVNSATPSIAGIGKAGATVNVSVNNNSYSTTVNQDGYWSVQIAKALNEGNNILYVTHIDKGNISKANVISFNVLTKAPAAPTIDYPKDGEYISTAKLNISGTALPDAQLQLKLNDKSYSTKANSIGYWSYEITDSLSDGSYTLLVTQQDAAGNKSLQSGIYFVMDTTVPQPPVINAPIGVIYSKNPIINGYAEPNAYVELAVNNRQYTTTAKPDGSWSINPESLENGYYDLSATQRDRAGNISQSAYAQFTVQSDVSLRVTAYDLTGAVLSTNAVIAPIGVSYSVSAPLMVNYLLKDVQSKTIVVNEAGLEVGFVYDKDPEMWVDVIINAVDKGDPSKVIYSATQSLPIDSNQVIAPPSVDNWQSVTNSQSITVTPNATVIFEYISADNQAAADLTISKIAIEGLAPTTAITYTPGNSTWTNKDVTATLLLSQGVIIKNNNSLNQYIFTQNGTFSFEVEDQAGGTYTIAATVDWIDKTPPMVSGIGNGGIYNYDTKITVEDTASGLSYVKLNDAPFISGSVITAEGRYNLYAQDNAGNTTELSFIIDKSAPVISNIYNYAKYNSDVTINTQDYISGISSIVLNDSPIVPGYKVTEEGSYKLIATDKAGNTTELDFSIDKKLPMGKISYNPPEQDWTSNVIAVLTTDKPVTINGITGTEFSHLFTANGLYTFSFLDEAGNVGTVTAGVTWIDNKPPVIEISSKGNYFSGEKEISYVKKGGSQLAYAKLNGSDIPSGTVVYDEGSYSVVAGDNAGNVAYDTFIIDKTPPVISGVVNGGIYNSDVMVSCFDNATGIKYASLNGTAFTPGSTITGGGSYTLEVADYGDNKTTVSFEINK